MLQVLSPKVVVALTRAQEARARAAAAPGGPDQLFWRELERRWMTLAQSEQMVQRIDAFCGARFPKP
jgi:hypothetical protein